MPEFKDYVLFEIGVSLTNVPGIIIYKGNVEDDSCEYLAIGGLKVDSAYNKVFVEKEKLSEIVEFLSK